MRKKKAATVKVIANPIAKTINLSEVSATILTEIAANVARMRAESASLQGAVVFPVESRLSAKAEERKDPSVKTVQKKEKEGRFVKTVLKEGKEGPSAKTIPENQKGAKESLSGGMIPKDLIGVKENLSAETIRENRKEAKESLSGEMTPKVQTEVREDPSGRTVLKGGKEDLSAETIRKNRKEAKGGLSTEAIKSPLTEGKGNPSTEARGNPSTAETEKNLTAEIKNLLTEIKLVSQNGSGADHLSAMNPKVSNAATEIPPKKTRTALRTGSHLAEISRKSAAGVKRRGRPKARNHRMAWCV